MANLKDIIKADIESVFFNENDFAEKHFVEGCEISLVIDNDALEKRKSGPELGIQESTVLFFAKSKELPEITSGSLLNFDGAEYIVDSAKENKGVTEVAMHQNRMM